MRYACVMTIMILLGCGAAQAQSATTTTMPSIGATSPLGMLGSSAAGGTGVPLGATEIDPGGLSPAAGCSAGISILGTPSTTGMSGTGSMGSTSSSSTSSTFDGGGVAGTIGTSSSSCPSGGSNVTTTGTASPLSGSSTNLAGGTIPLGATALDGGGLSPMIAVPAPAMPTPGLTTGCTGPAMIGSDPTASMNLTLGSTPGC